jgi:hypothetical protein
VEIIMKLRQNIAILALAITIFLFLSIIFLGMILNNKREDKINNEVKKMYDDFRGMQTLSLIMENYDDEMVCIAFESKLKELDSYIWKLGENIDKYRVATEEFQKDEYFLTQKKEFNENEVFYYLMMKRMITRCNIEKEPILFFYQNSADCKKCDDQSFVLNDINEIDDEKGKNEIAIFSFDVDLNITSINILNQYYKIDQYPCIAFSNNEKMCGMQDKNIIIKKICSINPKINICRLQTK